MGKSSRRAGALLLLGVALTACQEPVTPAPLVNQQEVFSTQVTLSFYGNPPETVAAQIFDRMHQIEAWMTDYEDKSEVSQVSAQAGRGPVSVSPETLGVIVRGLNEARLTGGIFDPTIGPVTHLWNVSGSLGTEAPRVPTAAQIEKARSLVDWQAVDVDPVANTVALRKPGMVLDLGGVAKGFALDEALRLSLDAGITSGILNMGNSSMALVGSKPGGKPWRVGVQDPFQAPGAYFAVVEGSAMTVETSGPYQKFFVADGIRYHHIMDPRTGSPARSGLEQVTLLLPLGTPLADGLSTSCFILGVEKGMALLESIPDAAGIFVTSDRKVHLSSRVGTRFQLKDPSFTVVPKS